jgi:hypothetical protein
MFRLQNNNFGNRFFSSFIRKAAFELWNDHIISPPISLEFLTAHQVTS